MEKIKSKLSFFKKLSLVQQLIVVLCFVGLLLVAVLMPIVDYNVTSIVDKQMYERLTISQYSIIYNNIMPYKQEKEVYHIIYDTSNNSFVQSNIGSVQVVYDLYSYLFKDDLAKIVNTDQEVLKNKGEYDESTYYYMITKINNTSKYLISLVDSEYSVSLITSLRNQIIYIQYGFFIIFALVMILWVLTLINPLKKIKNYIDNIKDRKDSDLIMNREDEIGIVSKALVEMKEDLDKQESIKEEMIHNISHDLKTPIALIQTYAQSIKDDVYPYGDKDSSIDIILENADRLEHKVKSFLYLNRLDYLQGEDNEIGSFAIQDLIEKIVLQMDFMKPDLHLETELEDVQFDGDEEHWRVAIENIIENASRYAKSVIKITLKEDYLEIYNDGENIDETTLPYLFDPYVKGVKGQFGLGLSIVSKISSMFQYSVTAKNHDVGVSFIFQKKK
ncbi:HAMP domain-containing sensor histidine kinase [Massilimicrobiota timonensis]|uniref:histidine kinase n=1 Tax=Massilimicrobiota timonensis TaxID=1776392 RepID=A0ABT7UKU9_9FIRM|nr:HAMP domain-containing sensor histidine kinase [Massilimicrobiota timonensis]MDM8196751.1 HAMP domain-containing sensor histidine kinase [Massilimicrobiota timonensis]